MGWRMSSLRHIEIDEKWGGCSGYCVDSSQEQISNYLAEYSSHAQLLAEQLSARCKRVAILKNLNVHEEHRGKGNGAYLLEDFLAAAEDLGATAVLLLADSAEAQRPGFSLAKFYAEYGFVAVCTTGAGPLMVYPEDIGLEVQAELKPLVEAARLSDQSGSCEP